MMRILLTLLLLASWTGGAQAKLKVVTSTTDIETLVRVVGGDLVDVQTLAKGYQDPHYLEAKPSQMTRLRRADLLGYVGLELEVGWLPLLVQGSRNPHLRAGEPGNLILSTGLELLEIPTGEVNRSEGDIHPLGNPHYWLDPRNEIIMAGTIAERLSELDPSHAAEFEANRATFATRMQEAITGWEERMAPWRNHSIICYHKQWEYLIHWLDLDTAAYVENKAGIPPSPKHIHALEQLITHKKIDAVVISNFFEPGPARQVANKGGVPLVILPASIGGEDGTNDPFAFFEYIVSALETAFQEANPSE